MDLPPADKWKADWDAPDKGEPAPDWLFRAFCDMCRRVERLEDELGKR